MTNLDIPLPPLWCQICHNAHAYSRTWVRARMVARALAPAIENYCGYVRVRRSTDTPSQQKSVRRLQIDRHNDAS